MANPPPHSNHGFPFYINGFYPGGLANSQHPENHHQQYQLQLQGQAHVVLNHNPHVLNSPGPASLFEQQKQQEEQFLRIQNEKLELALQAQREKQLAALKSLKNYSQKVLITKNGEIARAACKNKVLENRINSLEEEKMDLKKIIEEKEAAIIALHNQLEEEKKRARMFVENDEESIVGKLKK